mgnify:CR=1 FL=1
MNHDADIIERIIYEEHYALRRRYEYCSPVVTIQKNVRMLVHMKLYWRKKVQLKILFWAANRYYKRYNFLHILKKMQVDR